LNYLVASKDITVVSVANTTGSGITKTGVHIGDSLTDNNYNVQNLVAYFGGTGMTYSPHGTRNNNLTEGRGGWTATMYTASAGALGVTNAFYNPSTAKFDFSYYMQQQGLSNVDYVFVFLGTNDAKNTSTINSLDVITRGYRRNIKAITDSIRAYSDNIKICVCMLPVGAKDDWAFKNAPLPRKIFVKSIQNLNAVLLDLYDNKEAEGYYLVPTSASLDNLRGMQTSLVQTSSRITATEKRIIDPYHPTEEGYKQFADAEYAVIKGTV
jgi:lysophospholipase L1-like esterase